METNESTENRLNKVESGKQENKILKMYEKIKRDLKIEEKVHPVPPPPPLVSDQMTAKPAVDPQKPLDQTPIVKDNPNHYIEIKKENP